MPDFIPNTGSTPLIVSVNGHYREWLNSQIPSLVKRLKEIDYQINLCLNATNRNVSSLNDLFLEAKRVGERLNECHAYGLTIPN